MSVGPVRAECPACGAPVLRATTLGLLLECSPHPCAVWLPVDGGRRKTVREAIDGVAGHHEHVCPPAGQLALIEMTGKGSKR